MLYVLYPLARGSGIYQHTTCFIITYTCTVWNENSFQILYTLDYTLFISTYQNIDAIRRPTPIQSTNMTHRMNFRNPTKWMPRATAKPMEETGREKISLIIGLKDKYLVFRILVLRTCNSHKLCLKKKNWLWQNLEKAFLGV